MRQVKEVTHADGTTRHRVRFRQGGRETSETFRFEDDAKTFATLLDIGANGVQEALSWLALREQSEAVEIFGDYFDAWVEQLTGITVRTRDDYKSLRRRYLTELDKLPLALISRAHIAAIVNRLDREELSPKTIRNVMHMLSSVFSEASYDGLITRNPVTRIRLPGQAAVDSEAEPRFLTHDEAGSLMEAMPKHYQPFVAFLFGTGMRWSEATALIGRNVHLDAGTILVDRAWKRVPGGWEVGPPKSKKSRRTINAAVGALAGAAITMRGPEDIVFTTPRGNVIRHSNFYNRIWRPACEATGLHPRPTPHDTRHTFASWLLSDGIPLEAVQDQLGHESIETTRKVYAHLLPAVGVAAGKAASDALARALANRVEIGGSASPVRALVSAEQ